MEAAAPKTTKILAPCARAERGRRTCFSISPDKATLAYCSKKNIVFRSLKDPNDVRIFNLHGAETPLVVRFCPGNDLIASGDSKGIVKVWVINAKGEVLDKGNFNCFNGPVRDLAWSEDGKKVIAVGGAEPFAKLISVDLQTTKGDEIGHSKEILSVAVRTKRPFMATTGGSDFILGHHKFPPLTNLTLQKDHTNFVNSIAYSADNDMFVSASSDKSVMLWEAGTGKAVDVKFEVEHAMSVMDVAWVDAEQFITASNDGTLKLWNKKGGASVR